MVRFLKQSVLRFAKKEDGVTAVECALLLGVVVAICMIAIKPWKNESTQAAPEAVVTVEIDRG